MMSNSRQSIKSLFYYQGRLAAYFGDVAGQPSALLSVSAVDHEQIIALVDGKWNLVHKAQRFGGRLFHDNGIWFCDVSSGTGITGITRSSDGILFDQHSDIQDLIGDMLNPRLANIKSDSEKLIMTFQVSYDNGGKFASRHISPIASYDGGAKWEKLSQFKVIPLLDKFSFNFKGNDFDVIGDSVYQNHGDTFSFVCRFTADKKVSNVICNDDGVILVFKDHYAHSTDGFKYKTQPLSNNGCVLMFTHVNDSVWTQRSYADSPRPQNFLFRLKPDGSVTQYNFDKLLCDRYSVYDMGDNGICLMRSLANYCLARIDHDTKTIIPI